MSIRSLSSIELFRRNNTDYGISVTKKSNTKDEVKSVSTYSEVMQVAGSEAVKGPLSFKSTVITRIMSMNRICLDRRPKMTLMDSMMKLS